MREKVSITMTSPVRAFLGYFGLVFGGTALVLLLTLIPPYFHSTPTASTDPLAGASAQVKMLVTTEHGDLIQTGNTVFLIARLRKSGSAKNWEIEYFRFPGQIGGPDVVKIENSPEAFGIVKFILKPKDGAPYDSAAAIWVRQMPMPKMSEK